MQLNICRFCDKEYDPQQPLAEPAQQAGLIMAEGEYGDADSICGECLSSRGRLAMMYRQDYFSG
jgi:hypothetical protein